MVRAAVILFVFTSLGFMSSQTMAEFVYVQFNNAEMAISKPDASGISSPAESVNLDWVLEVAGVPTPEIVGAPMQSGYCVRVHYGSNNAVFTLGDPGKRPMQFEARQTSAPANCSDEVISQFEFEIHIVISARTRQHLGVSGKDDVFARVSMQIPGQKNELINVRDIQWRLEARNEITNQWELVGGLNLIEGFNSSGWLRYRNSTVRHILLLASELGDSTIDYSSNPAPEIAKPKPNTPVEIQYGVKDGLEAPQGALTADGAVWDVWEKNPIYKSLIVGWDAGKHEPVSMRLCEDTDCSVPLTEIPIGDNPFTIRRSDIPDNEKVYFIVEWADAKSRGEAVLSEEDQQEAVLSIAPTVAFGSYQRPLTACVGHLSTGQVDSPPFRFRLGRQELVANDLPAAIAEVDSVRVVFDKMRDGTKCPVAGLQTDTLPYRSLKAVSQTRGSELNVSVQAGLFVGYAQLNGAEYRNSLARWRETLNFYDALYSYGREREHWMDGVLFRAGERGGVQIQIEPSANFDTTLADDSALVESAKSLQTNTRVSSDLFSEQLAAIKDVVGNAQVNLVYFDDFPGGCGEYIAEIDQSSLQVESALVVSLVDGYTGSGALRSLDGGLAYVCEESENVRIYAFNWRERLLNLDWNRTFELILEDWKS